ncbi:hypothetical protein [Nocardia carnea]|uniref:hypothetical protein n=1 Tax=Nocardia carnea TaxID=37328 RepID=UPI00245813B4|nr:hypothetical protein [Nocardia carnea]
MTSHVIETVHTGPGQVTLTLPSGQVEVDAVHGLARARVVIEGGAAPQVTESDDALTVTGAGSGSGQRRSVTLSGFSAPGVSVGSIELTDVVAGSIKIGGVEIPTRQPDSDGPVSAQLHVPEGEMVTVTTDGPVRTRGQLALARVKTTGTQSRINVEQADKADLVSRGDITVTSAGRLFADSSFGTVTVERMDRGTVEAWGDIKVEGLCERTILESHFGAVFAHVSAPLKLSVTARGDITIMCDPDVRLLDGSQLTSTFGKTTFLTTPDPSATGR